MNLGVLDAILWDPWNSLMTDIDRLHMQYTNSSIHSHQCNAHRIEPRIRPILHRFPNQSQTQHMPTSSSPIPQNSDFSSSKVENKHFFNILCCILVNYMELEALSWSCRLHPHQDVWCEHVFRASITTSLSEDQGGGFVDVEFYNQAQRGAIFITH